MLPTGRLDSQEKDSPQHAWREAENDSQKFPMQPNMGLGLDGFEPPRYSATLEASSADDRFAFCREFSLRLPIPPHALMLVSPSRHLVTMTQLPCRVKACSRIRVPAEVAFPSSPWLRSQSESDIGEGISSSSKWKRGPKKPCLEMGAAGLEPAIRS